MSKPRVGIFFFRPALGGGTTTFTAHLYKAIEAAGARPTIYKVRNKDSEEIERQFGLYKDVWYRNISVKDAKRIVQDRPTVMSAPTGEKYLAQPDLIEILMKEGMRIVIHDPNEFTIYDHLGRVTKLPTRPICIRPTIQKFYKNAVWIPHPYQTHLGSRRFNLADDRKLAVSVARIASVKRPKIILEANRLLPKSKWIDLRGAEYRMYTYNLQKTHGDVFQQCGKTFQFPMTFAAPVWVCKEYHFNVDMTWFPNDGGGTQYAQMEAMDAGTVNVMHEDWFRYKGELRRNKRPHVLTVKGPKGLAKLLKRGFNREEHCEIIENGFSLLWQHDPAKIGKMYLEEIQ